MSRVLLAFPSSSEELTEATYECTLLLHPPTAMSAQKICSSITLVEVEVVLSRDIHVPLNGEVPPAFRFDDFRWEQAGRRIIYWTHSERESLLEEFCKELYSCTLDPKTCRKLHDCFAKRLHCSSILRATNTPTIVANHAYQILTRLPPQPLELPESLSCVPAEVFNLFRPSSTQLQAGSDTILLGRSSGVFFHLHQHYQNGLADETRVSGLIAVLPPSMCQLLCGIARESDPTVITMRRVRRSCQMAGSKIIPVVILATYCYALSSLYSRHTSGMWV